MQKGGLLGVECGCGFELWNKHGSGSEPRGVTKCSSGIVQGALAWSGGGKGARARGRGRDGPMAVLRGLPLGCAEAYVGGRCCGLSQQRSCTQPGQADAFSAYYAPLRQQNNGPKEIGSLAAKLKVRAPRSRFLHMAARNPESHSPVRPLVPPELVRPDLQASH